MMRSYAALGAPHELWQETSPPTLVIGEVEQIWAAIAERDDWQPFGAAVVAIRRLGEALGVPAQETGKVDGESAS